MNRFVGTVLFALISTSLANLTGVRIPIYAPTDSTCAGSPLGITVNLLLPCVYSTKYQGYTSYTVNEDQTVVTNSGVCTDSACSQNCRSGSVRNLTDCGPGAYRGIPTYVGRRVYEVPAVLNTPGTFIRNTFLNSTCDPQGLDFYDVAESSCTFFNTTNFAKYTCTVSGGLNTELCTDSACSSGCVQFSTAPLNVCVPIGNGVYQSFYCGGVVDYDTSSTAPAYTGPDVFATTTTTIGSTTGSAVAISFSAMVVLAMLMM